MAITLTPVRTPGTTVGATRIATFTVAALLADNGDSAATNHNLGGTPNSVRVVDTSAAATTQGMAFSVHTIGATQFTVRKLTTAENRSALIILERFHSIIA